MKNLSVAQIGMGLTVRFALPEFATDGRRLTKPLEVEIFRRITPEGPRPASLGTSKPWVTIRPQDLSRFERGTEIDYAAGPPLDEFPRLLGSLFSFKVVTLTRGFRGHPHAGAPSNIAEARLLNVSPPVEGLHVRQTPRALALEWEAPRENVINGAPPPGISGYRVYRATGGTPAAFKLLAEVRARGYDDSHFQFGHTYAYMVRAVFASGGYEAMSANSAPVAITPREIFPPPPPSGLTAVYTGRAVELTWKPELDPDVAGYDVYRQEPGRPAERLNPRLLRTPAFADSAIRRGARYSYWVTAVDAAHNESKPSSPVAAEVR